jgi:hypothetical protein
MRNMLTILLTTAIVAMSAAATAAMTRDEYKAGKARIAAEYEAERQKCGERIGNATDVCVALARGMRKASTAELEAAYKPGPRGNYEAANARADAEYGIATKRCGYKEGEERKECLKDAKAAQQLAKNEAKAAREAARREAAAK